MAQRSTTQRLADLLLGRPVEDFITERRAAGRSWRLVARDLYDATNGQLDATDQTMKNWLDAAESDLEVADAS